MMRLLKIKLLKMWQKTAAIVLPLVCITAFVLVVVLKVSPSSIYTIDDIQKMLKAQPKVPGPRNRDQLRRKEFVDKQCSVMPQGSAGSILVSTKYKMAYCIVPKAQSDFWVKAFRYLNDETANPVTHQERKIMLPHDVSKDQLKIFRLEKESDESVMEHTTKILFTKNPYSRLWQIYVENMFLPELWSEVGRVVASRRKVPKPLSLKCGHDVTFLEFLDYVALDGKKPDSMKLLWRPVQHLCSPCMYKPDFIGKVELFEVDANHILHRFGLSPLLNVYRSDRYEIDEMAFIINRYYAMFDQDYINDCISKSGLAMRLWTSFQVKGYLPLKSETVLEHITERTFDLNIFREMVINVYNQYRKSRYLWQNQHNKLLTGAYKEIPYRIFKNLTTIYEFDFKAFNYEMFPKQFLKV